MLVSTVIAGLALLAGSILLGAVGDRTAREADGLFARHVDEQTGRIEGLYEQAQRDIRLARQNSILGEVLAKPLNRITVEDRGRIDAALTYIGERYRVDETCLILANGTELGRWDHGHTAAVDDLSTEELINNPGVAPALALPDDTVHLSAPYVSPDTERWVTAFLTPIVTDGGRAAGVLHFEIPIQYFADELTADAFGSDDYSFLMDAEGNLIVHPDIASFRQAAGLAVHPDDSPFPPATARGSSSWRTAIEDAIKTGSGGATFEDAGLQYRLEFRSVDGPGWVLGTVVPTTSLYAGADRARLNLALTIGPLITLMVVISAWFSRRLSRTNVRLADANAALAQASHATSQLAAIVKSADDAIFSLDPGGRITTWNRAAADMCQVASTEAIGSPLSRLIPADDHSDLPLLLSAVLSGEPVQRYETLLQRADGSTFDAWLALSPIGDGDGLATGVSVIARDISDQRRLENQLAHQALHDALTGLPNRVLFQDRLRQSLDRNPGRRRRSTGLHAVLFIDLDDFKVINDSLGHRVGDELLTAMARRLEDCLRSGDTAARLSGDEFTVLLHDVNGIEDAEQAAQRILHELRLPFDLEDHQVVVSASIGIALGVPGVDDPDDLLRSADTALYEAKGRGKGRHETYQETMNVRAWRRLELEGQLRRAITEDQLRVHYQPIVDVSSGAVVMVEALVRWAHPTLGIVPPGEFIPLAEQTGLIVQIGEIVRDAAFRDLAAVAPRSGGRPVDVSVNVSPRELVQPEFVDRLTRALANHGLTADRLVVEITESAMLEGAGAIAAIGRLREIGVRVWIDDFGTGYSSLGYFRELPVDGLKIDRTFIEGLGRHRQHAAIVTAALAFAEALGLDVVGEGIETDDQRDQLGSLGCQLGQGFLFSRPVEAHQLPTLLVDVAAGDGEATSAA
jgi:diguanylate cyclase (GGDEF)-like protein/PAS domain S-box-containing protein